MFFPSIILFIFVSEINQNDRFIGTAIYNVLRENQPLKLLNESRIRKIYRGKDYPFVGLKWEATPCLPQEPHYFNSGSSQNENK